VGKGPGTIQQLILDATRHGGLYPVLFIAKAHDYNITKLSVRQSFSRAAYRLFDHDKVSILSPRVPTAYSETYGLTNRREVLCVAAPSPVQPPTDEEHPLDRFTDEQQNDVIVMSAALHTSSLGELQARVDYLAALLRDDVAAN